MPPKLIAFHLPQFHPIPENDEWWGKGFTEWTNVTRAAPLFHGHHQPQLPADLGFYDLRLPEAREAQATLAKEYGIHGFCYYHYWFNGRRLLERPVEEIVASGKPDFPFCLCWANENWSRRWDGSENEILIGQNYNDDDDRDHIRYLIEIMQDPRYIRIDGSPLILIYRAKHLPNPKRTTEIWRTEARKAGLGELFICRVENFYNERDDPHSLGFDASVDFQPDWKAITDENPSVVLPDEHFVVDYRNLVETQLARPDVEHLRFPGVTPAWDNSARRKKRAFITADSTPDAYEHWLTETIRRVAHRPESHQLVFINAWNEWAEGNHLEPDQKFGRGYLEATRRALEKGTSGIDLIGPPQTDPLTYKTFVPRKAYDKWLSRHRLSKANAELHDARLKSGQPPGIQIILDATRCDDDALSRSLKSISSQLYEHWHLHVLSLQPAPQIASSRLTWHTIIAQQATPFALQLVAASEYPWHTVINGGDQLADDALLFVGQQLLTDPQNSMVLCDGDRWLNDDTPEHTWLAPGFNPDWLRSTLHIGGLVVASTVLMSQALQDIGESPSNAHQIAVVLRAMEETGSNKPVHLPKIVLHRYAPQQAIPLEFRADLLRAHLSRLGLAADLEHGLLDDSCRVLYKSEPANPGISIVVAAPDEPAALLRSVEAILSSSTNSLVSILLPRQPSMPAGLTDCLHQLAALGVPNLRVVEVPDGSPSATANRLADTTDDELLLFLDCGLIPHGENWLDSLLRHAQRPGIGAAGGRVVATDGSLQFGPIRLGQMGVAATPHCNISADYTGNGGELLLEQNCSAVARACLMLRRQVFALAGGFNAERYPDAHADVDLCLRLQEQQLQIVWSPFSTVIASSTRTTPRFAPPQPGDTPLLEDWLRKVPIDPYFNQSLSRQFNRPQLENDAALAWDPLPWHPLPKVYVHPADFDGCGEMRISSPARTLSRSGAIQGGGGVRFLGPWEIAAFAPDSVVIQRPFNDIALDWLASYRRYSNSFLIYEIDDLISRIPPGNGSRADFPADIEARIAKGIGLCDRLVVSTKALAEAYGRYAKEVMVVPNLLDDLHWGALQASPVAGDKPRVGWAGSTSHGGDLAMIKDVIQTLTNEVDWVFLGLCPESLRPLIHEYHPAVAIGEYPAALAQLGLDIAIAPLEANAFNEAKSNLKLLEYGALGYPVVCSNVLPYQGDLPVVRVANTTQQWVAAIRRLVANPAERAALGQNLQTEVRSNWMIGARSAEWLAAWTRRSEGHIDVVSARLMAGPSHFQPFRQVCCKSLGIKQ